MKKLTLNKILFYCLSRQVSHLFNLILEGNFNIMKELGVNANDNLTQKDFKREKFDKKVISSVWVRLIVKTLDDFMIQVIIDATIFLMTLDMILLTAEEKHNCKSFYSKIYDFYLALMAGFVILLTIFIVTIIGSFIE
jgi:hypothetical protein